MGAGFSDSRGWMRPVLAAVSLGSLLLQQKPLPGSGCPSGQPLSRTGDLSSLWPQALKPQPNSEAAFSHL